LRQKASHAFQQEPSLPVFLYFWDTRDGPDFNGWWFGDRLGGTRVWARCENGGTARLPPREGWRLPWNGPINDDLGIEPKVVALSAALGAKEELQEQEGQEAGEEWGWEGCEEEEQLASKTKMSDANWMDAKEELAVQEVEDEKVQKERVQKATDEVVLSEVEASQVFECVRAMMEGDVDDDSLHAIHELLDAQAVTSDEALKVLMNDIKAAKKTAPTAVKKLKKLLPRLRSMQACIAQEKISATERFADTQRKDLEKKKRNTAAEEQLDLETRDGELLEKALPGVSDIITVAEDSLDLVVAAASSLDFTFAEELSEPVLAVIQETEAAAAQSQVAIRKAHAHITKSISAARRFAPEAQRIALSAFSEMQDKLNELQSKLDPYKSVRQDYKRTLEAKQVVADVATKLGVVEVEVAKVLGEDEFKIAKASLESALQSIESTMEFVDQQVESARGVLKEDLLQMQVRGREAKARLDEVQTRISAQTEAQLLQASLQQGLRKTQHAEEALRQVETATLDTYEDTVMAVDTAANNALTFLKASLVDAKQQPNEHGISASEELEQLLNRVDRVLKKLDVVKRETLERRTTSLVEEVTEKVVDAEAKVSRTAVAAMPLTVDRLEDVAVDTLKEACRRTLDAEKVAAIACVVARKGLITKQNSGHVLELPAFGIELSKLQERIDTAQHELGRLRKSTLLGEKIWKNKVFLIESELTMRRIKTEIEKAEKLATPLGDERPLEEHVLEMDKAIINAEEWLTGLLAPLDVARNVTEGSLNSKVCELLMEAHQFRKELSSIRDSTREQREWGMCRRILSEAQIKLDKVELAFQLLAEAEAPHAKGSRVLPVGEATRLVADSEAAAAAAQKAIVEARTFLDAKSVEVREFMDQISKAGLERIATLTAKNESAVTSLTKFTMDIAGRRRMAIVQEAQARVVAAEEAATDRILAGTRLATHSVVGDAPEEERAICERLWATDREAEQKLNEARKYVSEKQREKNWSMNPAESSKLLHRVASSQAALAKARTSMNEQEQVFLGKVVMLEAMSAVQDLEVELQKSADAAVPLTADDGKSFLLADMMSEIAEALTEYTRNKAITMENLFEQMCGDAGNRNVAKTDFPAFLAKVPVLCSRPELTFSDEQSLAIFEQADADADGELSKRDFANVFGDRFACVHESSVTDRFDSGTAVTTLKVDDVVVALSEPRLEKVSGAARIKVRVFKDGTTGWVTMRGEDEVVHLQPFTELSSLDRAFDRTAGGAQASAAKASSFIRSRRAEFRRYAQGPLAEGATELARLEPRIDTFVTQLEQLRRRVEEGKIVLSKKAEAERARRRLRTSFEATEAAEAALSELAAAAAPLAGGTTVAPLTAQHVAEAAAHAVNVAVAAARERVTNAPEYLGLADLEHELGKLRDRIRVVETRANVLGTSVQKSCDAIGDAILEQVSVALCGYMNSCDCSPEALFAEFADGSGERIEDSAFCSQLNSLPSLELSAEQKQFLIRRIGNDGSITRRAFLQMVERYMKCSNAIAITTALSVKHSSTLRRLEIGEVVSVLEGPSCDEELGMLRVRCRALSDGVAGWITKKGNHGKVFLQECAKPCLVVVQPAAFQDNFLSDDSQEIRILRPAEVLELLEGPRPETPFGIARVRAKACTDGAAGWFTLTGSRGEVHARVDMSYYKCTGVIALTDGESIKESKVLRKVSVGETLLCLEGPSQDASGTLRIKARALEDGAEGWVTVRGNAGTVYASQSTRHYAVERATPLQSAFQSAVATTVRTLEEHEVVEALEGPVDEKIEAAMRARGRAVIDGRIGWVSIKAQNLKPWSPQYRCVRSTGLTNSLEVSSAQTICSLEPGEALELIEGPREDTGSGLLRLRCRVARDAAVGWVTIIGEHGHPFLSCLPPPR